MKSLGVRRVLDVLCTILFGSVLSAQQPFNALVFMTGATTMSVDALNAQLTNAHFAGLSNDGVSYGASGYFTWGRAMLGAEFSRATFGEEGLSNGRTDDLNAMQYLGTVSFALVTSSNLTVYPTLGVGKGSFDVTLRDRSPSGTAVPSTPTFAEVAANPGSATTLNGSHLVYSVGAGMDYLATRGGGSVGVVLGIRAGYLLAPNRTTWTARGSEVVAGPDGSAGGPFVRLVVGVGGR
jgi:hypothetical protein